MARVLITGVRGKTGAPLAQLLAAHPGVEVLGGSSDTSRVAIENIRPIEFSWDETSGWAAATDGIDAVYLVRPDRADAPELITALLAQTPERTHVVLLSDQDADSVTANSWTPRVERSVHQSGRSWTVLRPSWFMQVLTDPRFVRDQIARHGQLPFSSGGASVAWIDARDVAAVAERALLTQGHAGQVYELSGPEALTLARTVELLSHALQRPITHVELTIEEAVAGMQGFERDLNVATFERLHAGLFATVTNTVQRVTGRPARTLQTFLADYGPLGPQA